MAGRAAGGGDREEGKGDNGPQHLTNSKSAYGPAWTMYNTLYNMQSPYILGKWVEAP